MPEPRLFISVVHMTCIVACGLSLEECQPSAKDVMQDTFSQDPPAMVEYQTDGSRIYKTRNIVLYAEFAKTQLSSLVMLVALPEESAGQDSSREAGGLIKFRSIDRIAHFETHRELILTVAQ